VKEVAISEFKAKCLALLEQVQKTKKPLRVTRFGKPIADVRDMEILGDIISPATDEAEWEVLRD
jgi:prevent-host-death family protein